MNILAFLRPKSTAAYLYIDNTVRQGIEKMRIYGYTAIPVIDKDGVYCGTVSEGDFLWNMLYNKKFDIKDQEKFFVKDIMRKDWNPAVKINAGMDDLVRRIMEQNFVPVVDDRGVFVGIITRKDIINYLYIGKEEKA